MLLLSGILQPHEKWTKMNQLKIAVKGVQGSFHEIAVKQYFTNKKTEMFGTIMRIFI